MAREQPGQDPARWTRRAAGLCATAQGKPGVPVPRGQLLLVSGTAEPLPLHMADAVGIQRANGKKKTSCPPERGRGTGQRTAVGGLAVSTWERDPGPPTNPHLQPQPLLGNPPFHLDRVHMLPHGLLLIWPLLPPANPSCTTPGPRVDPPWHTPHRGLQDLQVSLKRFATFSYCSLPPAPWLLPQDLCTCSSLCLGVLP